MNCDWSLNEKEEYKRIRIKKLGTLYAYDEIPVNNPQARLSYVKEKLLESAFDCKDFDELIEKYGRPKTLKILEKRVVKKFF